MPFLDSCRNPNSYNSLSKRNMAAFSSFLLVRAPRASMEGNTRTAIHCFVYPNSLYISAHIKTK